MAVDVGTVRIGLAKSDPSGRIALPIATIAAKPRDAALQVILTYARELRPSQVLVGLPLTLEGEEATASMRSRRFAAQLQKVLPCRVAMIDERLTTVVAEAALRAGLKAWPGMGIDACDNIILPLPPKENSNAEA